MRLTQQTDYALRSLMMLAANPDRLMRTAEIADRFGISKNHLMKITQTLVHMGVLEGVRGRSGGVRLAQPAEDVVVGAIVRALETDSPLVECFPGGSGGCILGRGCRLKGAFSRAQEQFFATLDGVTLAELVEPKSFAFNTLAETAA